MDPSQFSYTLVSQATSPTSVGHFNTAEDLPSPSPSADTSAPVVSISQYELVTDTAAELPITPIRPALFSEPLLVTCKEEAE
jgi:hypothetical protein